LILWLLLLVEGMRLGRLLQAQFWRVINTQRHWLPTLADNAAPAKAQPAAPWLDQVWEHVKLLLPPPPWLDQD
jgi:hypothetical protein